MRRSAHVFAPLLASTALVLLAGCHKDPEMQRCVDEKNQVVDPKFCQNLPPGNAQPAYGHTGSSMGGAYIPHMYRYYYGGLGGYALGSMVSGGGYAPAAGHSYSTTSGTSRGGFGRSFSSGSSSSSSSHGSSSGGE